MKVASEALDVQNRFAERAKASIKENTNVLISMIGTLMAFVAALLAMAALMSVSAETENLMSRVEQLEDRHDVTQIYVRDLKAYMIEQGFKPPREADE